MLNTRKIKHLSLSSEQPELAAKRLAEATGGEAIEFPSSTMTGAWMCVWDMAQNELIEFIPNNYALQWGEHSATYVQQPNALTYSNAHCLLEYSGKLQTIVDVAEKYGLKHRFRERFGGPLYELWLEDNLLIEFISKEIKSLGA